MSKQPPLFEKIKEKYGAYPKQMMVNLEVAKTMDKKSQTRRVIPFKIYTDTNDVITAYSDTKNMRSVKATIDNILQKSVWKKGDILWVREPVKIEAFEVSKGVFEISYADDNFNKRYDFIMPDKHIGKSWTKERGRVPNGCIKEMARTFLRVTNVRVERLQVIDNINAADGYYAEGLTPINGSTAKGVWNQLRKDWIKLWDKTAPKGYKWEDNPWVFVYEFEKVEYQK